MKADLPSDRPSTSGDRRLLSASHWAADGWNKPASSVASATESGWGELHKVRCFAPRSNLVQGELLKPLSRPACRAPVPWPRLGGPLRLRAHLLRRRNPPTVAGHRPGATHRTTRQARYAGRAPPLRRSTRACPHSAIGTGIQWPRRVGVPRHLDPAALVGLEAAPPHPIRLDASHFLRRADPGTCTRLHGAVGAVRKCSKCAGRGVLDPGVLELPSGRDPARAYVTGGETTPALSTEPFVESTTVRESPVTVSDAETPLGEGGECTVKVTSWYQTSQAGRRS